MSSGVYQRGLDLAPTATIDKVALNNKVVLMRAIVRRSKLHLINGLVKKVHKLRDKKGSEAQKNQNKSKADKMLEDIKIIKVLKPDYVSKYALGTTVKFEELAAKASTTPEMRALARLAAHKFIMQEVEKFRQAHEDWKDLAAYLMTKHTSREFKKKKTKETKKKVETNVIASENLVQKYLGEKLEGRTDLEDVIDDDDNTDDEIDDSINEHETNDKRLSVNNTSEEEMSENMNVKKKTCVYNDGPKKTDVINKVSERENFFERGESDQDCDDVAGENSDDDDEDIDSNNDLGDKDKDYDIDEGNDGSKDDGGGDDDDDETIQNTKDNAHFSKVRKKETGTEKRVTKKTKDKYKDLIDHKMTENIPKTGVSKEKVEGEMIVKKLNLNKDFIEEDIPKILLCDNEDKHIKRKKKRKDLFFDTGEDYDSGKNDGDENNINDTGDLDRGENESSENNSRENNDRGIQPTMTAFTTCFVGSLKSSDMMGCNDSQYRSNEDWKRIRHETKEQKFGSGRGQGPLFRGRGFSNSVQSHRGRGFSDGLRGRGFTNRPQGRGNDGRGRSSGGFRGKGLQKGEAGGKQSDHKKPVGLHPSWEASKKRKQEQKAVLQAFEGKKIKFDD